MANTSIKILLNCARNDKFQNAGELASILMRKNGIFKFILETMDFDSSEIKTTLDMRFHAFATIIADMPVTACNTDEYYENIFQQLFHLLSSPGNSDADSKMMKLCATIFIRVYKKNICLGRKIIVNPIINTISCAETSVFSLTQCLTVIHNVILNDFDKNQFIPAFQNIYAVYVILFGTVSPIKVVAKEIILDMLKFVDQSIYMMDSALFKLQTSIHLYTTGLEKYGKAEILTVIPNSNDKSEDDLKLLDKTVTATLDILDELGNEFKLDFFLILIAKSHLSKFNEMVLFSLIDSLQEQISKLILDYPDKAIQFLSNTLRRITSDSNDSIQSMMDQEDLKEEAQILKDAKTLQMDSLSILVQIVSILIEAKDKLTSDELVSLKTCNVYLSRVVASELLSKSELLKIESLISEINNLDGTSKRPKIDSDDKFKEAVRCLNSDFMPQRAHGLVILRNLIDSNHQSTIDHKSELFTLIKACLSDPDSYVYLAAVNALASLALAHTDSCLPTLIEAYHDRDRSVRERVSVGESLVWVCKYFGQLAHHYYRPVVNCFLIGLKDEDESIRVSSLSNLGQFCSSLKNALSYCIIEIISAVECLLKTDSSLDVKRACLMFLYIMLNGIENFEVILDHLKQIYHIIKAIDSKSLGDDIIRVHAHLALQAIDDIMKSLINQKNDLIRPIKMN